MSNEKYTFMEVCAGCGGLSTGLMKAGLEPLLLNDIDKNCCETLKLNHKNVNVINCSLTELKLDKYTNKVDLLTGGIPCQPYSFAGLRQGLQDERSKPMMSFINMVDIIKPKIFMIENVKGLVNHDGGKTLEIILDKLDKNKLYDIRYKVLNAMHYDVPQKRERLIIIGVLKQYNVQFKFPSKSDNIPTLSDALKNVPKSIGSKYPEKKKKLFKLIPQGGCWINLPVDAQKEYLGKSYNSGGGKRGILKRLSMDSPSLTILCSPSQKQTERCHPIETRPLTIRETARIQTFPDEYEFYGSLSSQYKQLGNAVPVTLAYKLGQRLIRCIDKINEQQN